MNGLTNYRRGFKSREAAEDFQMKSSIDPAYCSLHPAIKGSIFVRDPIHKAGGRVHVASYVAKSKGDDYRNYWSSWVGA